MVLFLKVLGNIGNSVKKGDGDFFLRLNYFHTPIVLVAVTVISFLVFVFAPMFGSPAVNCWTPGRYRPAHEEYTKFVCSLYGSGYKYTLELNKYQQGIGVPPPKPLDQKYQQRPDYRVSVILLLFQAILFIIPIFIWKAAVCNTGITVPDFTNEESEKPKEKFIEQFDKYSNSSDEERENLKRCSSSFCFGVNRFFGCFLLSVFIALKCWYIGNIFLQLAFIFGPQANYATSISDIFNFSDTQTSFVVEYFCDFRIMENNVAIHKHTVQCVASTFAIQLTQGLYTALVMWLVVLFFANCYSLLSWVFYLWRIYTPIKQSLMYTNENEHHMQEFIDDYLKKDGVLLLGMIDRNTAANNGQATGILEGLWKQYLRKKHFIRATAPDPSEMDPLRP
ncbi:innexin unc-7 [Lingula anatina]|uniref:Innexin n=1 Tax=Lingula anatina TaxID=7574 RepID=A0A1S3HLZ7_LINAN|nr:innexin unc-7 [Lingula anatina]|eukprot:XP_013386049.1 innexin unc-7 [Lingula anatina]